MRTHIKALKYIILAFTAILVTILLVYTQPQNDLIPLLQGKQLEKPVKTDNQLIIDAVNGAKREDIKQTVMQKPNYLGEDLNNKLWSLKATRAIQSGEVVDGHTDLFDVVANTLSVKDKKVDYVADQGRYLSKTHDILLEGNVLIKSETMQLTSETLQYNLKSGYAESNTPVDIKAEFGNIVGDTMKSYNNAEKIVLKGNVRAKLYDKNK